MADTDKMTWDEFKAHLESTMEPGDIEPFLKRLADTSARNAQARNAMEKADREGRNQQAEVAELDAPDEETRLRRAEAASPRPAHWGPGPHQSWPSYEEARSRRDKIDGNVNVEQYLDPNGPEGAGREAVAVMGPGSSFYNTDGSMSSYERVRAKIAELMAEGKK